MSRRRTEGPTCPVCLDHMVHAVTTGCGHSFCGECGLRLLRDRARSCAVCRERIASLSPSHTLRQLVPDGDARAAAAAPTAAHIDAAIARELHPRAQRTSQAAYLVLLVVVLYVVSPVDMIPESAGVVGLVDDLLVLALGAYALYELGWFTRAP